MNLKEKFTSVTQQSTLTSEKIEKLMTNSYKYFARIPSAFCTIDYGIFFLNFLIYSFADLKDINFCVDHIDSFLIFAGLILFFSAKH
jgi:hypothetical protein